MNHDTFLNELSFCKKHNTYSDKFYLKLQEENEAKMATTCFCFLLLSIFMVVHAAVYNEKLKKPLKPAENILSTKRNIVWRPLGNVKHGKLPQQQKKQFIPGQQFWSVNSPNMYQQQPPPQQYSNNQQQTNTLFNQQPMMLANQMPQAMYQQVPNSFPVNNEIISSNSPTPNPLNDDVTETNENVNAAYKGLSFYTGSLVAPKLSARPAGFPVSLDVDKEPATTPLTTTTTTTTSTSTEQKISANNRDQVIMSYAKLEYGEGAGKKVVPDARQFFQKPPPDVPMNKLGLLFNSPKTTSTPPPMVRTTVAPTTTTSTPTTTTSTTTNKSKDKEEDKKDESEATVCYLPRIAVNTRLMGTTVVNEIKIYTRPRDETSVHRFITSHEVSDAASRISHEFVLPPQFVTQKSLSAADLKFMNNTPVLMTSAYTETNHHHPPLLPIQLLTQYPMYVQSPEVVRNTPTPGGPTFNPYLPTTKVNTTSTKTPTSTTSTTPNTTTTSTTPSSTTTSTTPSTTTTSTTTTPSTTTTSTTKTSTTTSTTTTTTPIPTTTTPSIVEVKSKKRHLDEILNFKARHRNAMQDLPGGDSAAFSGYQILGPPDIKWIKQKSKSKR